MLPARCRKLPCMNIEVKTVTHHEACSGASPVTPSWPSQTICVPVASTPQ